MEQAKEFMWKKILNDIENSKDKNLKDAIRAFENEEDMRIFIKFYVGQSFDNMKRLNSFGAWIRREVYHDKHKRLLGTQTKAMPDDIYIKTINYVRKKCGNKIALALEFEGIQGARGEDTVRIQVNDFDFNKHTVTILNRKVNRTYSIPLNKEFEVEIQEFIIQNCDKITKKGNYVFFSENKFQVRQHISEKFLSNVVRQALKELRLNKIYAHDYLGRPLYLYSLHSFRGHACSRVVKNSNGDYRKGQELLDHESTQTTMLYVEKDNLQDLKGVI